MGNSASNDNDSASDASGEEQSRAPGSPAVMELPSGMRLMVDVGTRQIHLLGPEPEDGDSEGDVYQEEVNVPPLHLLTRIMGGPRHFTFTERSQNIVLPEPEPVNAQDHFHQQIMHDTGQLSHINTNYNICQQIEKRQHMFDTLSLSQRVSATMDILPKHPSLADRFDSRAYCGTYSRDGSLFLAASQNRKVYVYDTTGNTFSRIRTIDARDVGWAVIDVAFSPDQRWCAYSTWSPCVSVCSVTSEELHYSLDLLPEEEERFGIFSIRFSGDNKEILAGACDGCLYVYNREREERTMRVKAHDDDVNAVEFADESSQVIFSGGDDGLLRVWDQRTLSEANPEPVGIFAGHKDGIGFIDSKGDGRYAISNSKDQSIKLWDMRRFASQEGVEATLNAVKNQGWDYRFQMVPKSLREAVYTRLPGDVSVTTYAGHWFKQCLSRCRFSPMFTTGQRYIYIGCASSRVIIYDALTAKIVDTLTAPSCCTNVRDVSWHPYEPGLLVAATWDGYLQMWSPDKKKNLVKEAHQRRIFDV